MKMCKRHIYICLVWWILWGFDLITKQNPTSCRGETVKAENILVYFAFVFSVVHLQLSLEH